ncbi:MAG: WD40/YVTN/BNR-like repeat-containing protein, partial [Candidatus Promineifilaceae bacterium]
MNTATKQSKITNGGTILSVSSSADRAWIGSRAGLFVQTGDQWQPVVREVPFWGVSTLLHADDDLLVAGMPEGLILSADGGKHWRRATIEQTSLPITCLVASPTYRDDDVVLAGTAGDGVLRSSDGGRYWELHNWGMDNLDVLALAVAPDWGRRQFVLASTANGIYRSPNGGRAWQRVQQSP